jgi:hypothetical protein
MNDTESALPPRVDGQDDEPPARAMETHEIRDRAELWSAFLRARYVEAAAAIESDTDDRRVSVLNSLAIVFGQTAYTHGALDTALNAGDIPAALGRLAWLEEQGRHFPDHPERPASVEAEGA